MDRDSIHDLNNCLASIITYTGFLVEDLPAQGKERKFAESIRKSALEAQKIVSRAPGPGSYPEPLKRKQKSARIVVVDDQADIREMMVMMLERMGHRASSCEDGLAAIQYLERHAGEINLVITDQEMPGMTGMELAGKTNAIYPDMPVILLSGHTEQTLSGKSGCPPHVRAIVRKPVLQDDLSRAIGQALPSSAL
jgi:CheY-like chemotaxis protein